MNRKVVLVRRYSELLNAPSVVRICIVIVKQLQFILPQLSSLLGNRAIHMLPNFPADLLINPLALWQELHNELTWKKMIYMTLTFGFGHSLFFFRPQSCQRLLLIPLGFRFVYKKSKTRRQVWFSFKTPYDELILLYAVLPIIIQESWHHFYADLTHTLILLDSHPKTVLFLCPPDLRSFEPSTNEHHPPPTFSWSHIVYLFAPFNRLVSLKNTSAWQRYLHTLVEALKVLYLSKFLRRSLMIFIIKGFRTSVFIFIVIFTTFQSICLLTLGIFTELRTTSFIESTGVACSDSIRHNQVQVLSIHMLLLAYSQDWTCNLQMTVSLQA